MRLERILMGVAVAATLTTTVSARDYIRIAGSSTVFPFSSLVVEVLGNNPNFKMPVVESGGSSLGEKGAC